MYWLKSRKFVWLAGLTFVLMMMLSGCVANNVSKVNFTFGQALGSTDQVYVRYSDSTTSTSTESNLAGKSSVTIDTYSDRTIVGAYLKDGDISWVPDHGYGPGNGPNSYTVSVYNYTINTNLVNTPFIGVNPISNTIPAMPGSLPINIIPGGGGISTTSKKPSAPASYAVLQDQPSKDVNHEGYTSVTFAVYTAAGTLVDGNTEVFAHSSKDVTFFNIDPTDATIKGPFNSSPIYTRTDTVKEGYSSHTENGFVTFDIQSNTSDISSIPLELYSGPNLLLDTAAQKAVAADIASLNIEYASGDDASKVTNNVTLPTSGANGTSISWSSSNTSVVSTTGEVNRPSYDSGDANVTVTARVYKNNASEDKPFALIVKRTDPPSHSTGSGGGSTAPTTTIKIHGVDVDTKVTHETSTDGQPSTKVVVDADKLTSAFALGQNKVITLGISSTDPIVKVELPSNALLDTASKSPNAIVQVKVDGASYSLPADVIKNLPKDSIVTVTITKLSGKSSDDVNSAAQKQGSKQLVTNAIDFKVTYGDKEVTDFNGKYLDRTLSLTSSADFNKSTAVWVDANNKMHFIPSTFTTNGGSTEVTIHSPHNSVYTAIQSDKTFADLQKHWAKADVELLANKLVVDGVTSNSFAPDKQITRAEFAALLVRALGLLEVNGGSSFTDVKATDWYAGAVGTAQKAGFITGYEDGTFKPNANITREQMVAMIQRAIKFAGKDAKANTAALNKFNDQSTIAGWAKDAAAQALGANIIEGTSDTTFAAKENATRAQSASMLKRMMQFLQFIN
ncbi:S-layer homology domain-containing protein [Paenibacillus sp. GCM10027628]|uniref:S-layer homology domain-containing protein n=1 Tax=Paenibacillus sp. GCM10027628 TaxID=3273413 RepID=UPI00362C9626